MEKNRLEAFSDGVFAIVITIMVLEFRPPHQASWDALKPLINVFAGYVLSFIYIGIYWTNHHHMMHMVHKVKGGILWANLHLLFWITLIPFATAWLASSGYATIPTAFYGCIFLMAGFAYSILQTSIIRSQGPNSPLLQAVGGDFKGKFSVFAYLAAIGLSFVSPWFGIAIYAGLAIMWFVPDPRIERRLSGS